MDLNNGKNKWALSLHGKHSCMCMYVCMCIYMCIHVCMYIEQTVCVINKECVEFVKADLVLGNSFSTFKSP